MHAPNPPAHRDTTEQESFKSRTCFSCVVVITGSRKPFYVCNVYVQDLGFYNLESGVVYEIGPAVQVLRF